MTKSKSSASSAVVPSIFVMHSVNVPQFLNAPQVTSCPIIVILHLTRYKHRCNHEDLGFNRSAL